MQQSKKAYDREQYEAAIHAVSLKIVFQATLILILAVNLFHIEPNNSIIFIVRLPISKTIMIIRGSL